MAKGARCPSCGEQKMHEEGAVYVCGEPGCNSVGLWRAQLPKTGGGKGAKCQCCGQSTLHTVYKIASVRVRYCTTCDLVVLTA